ncbi:MAG: hypothetical protein O7D86_01370 [Proteobacteria bacterium]|nr:hypothetical protein [Pseudomonadota bacterium]
MAKDTPNTEPRALRIQNVTTAGFDILQVRPTVCGGCSDVAGFNVHNVNWIAIEPGRHTLPGGGFIEVGTTSTTTVQKNFAGTEGWDTIAFTIPFSSSSIAMVGQVQTNNNGVSTTGGQTSPFITTVIRNANASNFQTALQLSEVVTPLPLTNPETIGWLAAPSGLTDTLTDTGGGSVLIEAILSANSITNVCLVDNNYSNTYSSNPLVVASMDSLNGNNGGWMRECQIMTAAVRLRVQEDEDSDNEVVHIPEPADIFVVEKAFDAEINISFGIPTMEIDSITLNNTLTTPSFTSVNFGQTYPAAAITDFNSTQIAGVDDTIHITAFGTTPTDLTCGVIEAYTGNQDLKLWSTYSNPGSGTIQVDIDSNPIATTEAGSAIQTVTFASGKATVTANYKDVGETRISMKDDTGSVLIQGATDLFVVKPARFTLSSIILPTVPGDCTMGGLQLVRL